MCVKCAVIVFREFDFSMFRITDMLLLRFRSREDLSSASCVLIRDVLHAAGYERKPTLRCCSSNKQEQSHSCSMLFTLLYTCIRRNRIVACLRAGRSGVRIRAGITDFSLLHNFQTGCWANPASCSVDTGDSLRGSKTAGV